MPVFDQYIQFLPMDGSEKEEEENANDNFCFQIDIYYDLILNPLQKVFFDSCNLYR